MEGSAQVGCQDWDLHVSKYGPVCVSMRILQLFLIICFFYGKKKIYLAYMQCEVTFIPHLRAMFLQMVCLRLIVQFVPSAPLIFSVDLHIFRPGSRIYPLTFS